MVHCAFYPADGGDEEGPVRLVSVVVGLAPGDVDVDVFIELHFEC